MQNIDPFPGDLVDFKYDLKMSTVSREQLKPDEVEIAKKHLLGMNPDYAEILKGSDKLKIERSKGAKKVYMTEKIKGSLSKLKDIDFLNFHESLPIAAHQASVWETAQAKIIKDVHFLESVNIMDYSLIITVAHVKENPNNGGSPGGSLKEDEKSMPGKIMEEEKLPEEYARLQRNGNCLFSPSGKFAYVFGIIDILQEYDIEKKGEGGLKGVIGTFSGKTDVSCQPPNIYAERFLGKLGGVFCLEGKMPGQAATDPIELSIIGGNSPSKKKND